MDMQSHLSPKDLALVIGVSESSLKRWVDDGRLRAERTSGGHRRIPLVDAVRFIRETAATIADPALLGIDELDSAAVAATMSRGGAERAILAAASERKPDRAVGVLLAEFLRSRAVAAVCDGPLTMLLSRAEHEAQESASGAPGIRAADALGICRAAVARMSSLLAEPATDAPAAAVGSVGGEFAAVRAAIAALVLKECGYRVADPAMASGNGHVGRESLVCTVFDRGAALPAVARPRATDGRVEQVWMGPGAADAQARGGVRIAHSLGELACLASAALPPHAASISTRPTRTRSMV
jgi:excisionase family DNA binding protein